MYRDKVTCATGCALQARFTFPSFPIMPMPAPELFCAGVPEAQVGDACSTQGVSCVPTHARLAADGTVASQTYLACDPTTNGGVCAIVPAPTITNYLTACSVALVAQFGIEDVNGVVVPDEFGGCLLAWDPAAGAVTSGITRRCLGDWQCPDGSLCDDQLNKVSGASPAAVCKPGPRGMLTPAMLSPSP